MIQVTCACGATMQVQDENAGKQCKCPKCGAVCQIPEGAAAVEAPAAAPAAAAPAAAAPAPVAQAPAAVAGKRPGGLTALAVLNFVFGGFGVIWGLIVLAGTAFASSAGDSLDKFAEAARQAAREAAQRSGDADAIEAANKLAPAVQEISTMFYILGILALVTAGLLIVAGVGYLKQSKKTGWMFGNVYGIASIVITLLQGAMIFGFGIGTVFWLAYPIITLALLNTSFKNSFPNP